MKKIESIYLQWFSTLAVHSELPTELLKIPVPGPNPQRFRLNFSGEFPLHQNFFKSSQMTFICSQGWEPLIRYEKWLTEFGLISLRRKLMWMIIEQIDFV